MDVIWKLKTKETDQLEECLNKDEVTVEML